MFDSISVNKRVLIILASLLFFVSFLFLYIYDRTRKNSKNYDIEYLTNANSDQKNIMPIVIIGSGPAGLGAGIYGSRLGFKTLVIEGSRPGGQLTQTSYVENWPGEKRILGPDLMKKMKEQNEALGVIFLQDDVTAVNFSKWPFEISVGDNKINALSVVIATGSSPRILKIPGEKEYWGKGVTTCAVCDAPFYKNKNVIVIGAGDSAAEQVLQLSPHVNHIDMLVRGNKFRASKAMQDKIATITNLTVYFNKELKKIVGNESFVTGVEIFDNLTKSIEQKKIDGVFLAIGHEPNTKIFKNQISMDRAGYIILNNRDQETSINGVFAAGDVEDYTYMQAGVAAGSGIKAALDASKFLHNIGFSPTTDKLIQEQNKYFVILDSGPAKVSEIKSSLELEKFISGSDPVILDFWSPTCPSCIHMLPSFNELSKKYSNKIKFIKINIDEAKDVVEKLYVLKVPTFIIYKNGQIIARYSEFMDKSEMDEFIRKVL